MNIPNIDFFGKLITFIGLAIIILAGLFHYVQYNKINDSEENWSRSSLISGNQVDKLGEMSKKYRDEINSSVNKMSVLVGKMKDSLSEFPKLNKQFKIELANKEKMEIEYNSIRSKEMAIFDSLIKIASVEEKLYGIRNQRFNQESNRSFLMIFVGLFILMAGIFLWKQREDHEKILLTRQNLDKPTYSNACQSCGKEFDSVIIAGTEEDNSKNYHFCKDCYLQGQFTSPDLTLTQLQISTQKELELAKLSKGKINKILQDLMKLDRWRTNRFS